jgi:FkbM family methyltransferase
MKMIKRIWNCVPEGPVKNLIRTELYNRRVGDAAHFTMRKGTFITDINDIQFKTYDHPFEIVGALEQYLAKHSISEGECVIDAGAFHGHLALFFALKVGPSGQVISIEPDDSNNLELRKNINLNRSVTNIDIIDSALWDRPQLVEFGQQGTVASSSFWFPEGAPRVQKNATTIDAIVEDLNPPSVDFIKMDIEGAEIKAIDGAARTIRKFKPDFAIGSYHIVDSKPTRSFVEDKLSSFGYDVKTLFFGKECITYGTASAN